MPIHTEQCGLSPVKPMSTSSGQVMVCQERRKSGMLSSLTRAGLVRTRPGRSGTIVESTCVEAYRLWQEWTV